MSKQWKPGKSTVELQEAPRPSRIRRDPPPVAPAPKALSPYPTEREVWTVVIGVVLFTLALTALSFGIGFTTE